MVNGCTFTGNLVIGGNGGEVPPGQSALGDANGSAIHIEGSSSTLTVIDSTFTGNEAIAGSGASAPNSTNNAVISVIDAASGSAISAGKVANIIVSGSTFTDNEAIGGSNASGSNISIGSLGFLGIGVGGAIYVQGESTITASSFAGNEAMGGSGDSYTGSGGTVLVGYGAGGAIYNDALHNNTASWSVSNSVFTNNQALGGTGNTGGVLTGDGVGGAITANDYGQGAVTGTLSGSTFSDNQAIGGAGSAGGNGSDGLGGALANLMGSTLTVSNCTLSGNQPSAASAVRVPTAVKAWAAACTTMAPRRSLSLAAQ
jgi:hypothetical protein